MSSPKRASVDASGKRKPWGSGTAPSSMGGMPPPPIRPAPGERERRRAARSPASRQQQPTPPRGPGGAASGRPARLHGGPLSPQQAGKAAPAAVEVVPFAEVPEPSDDDSYDRFRATVYEINRIKRAQNDARFRLFMLERQQMKEILGEGSDDEFSDDVNSEPSSPAAAARGSRRRTAK